MKTLEELRIKIYADGADLATMIRLNSDPLIKGLTTNPTLMRKAGISDYEAFARAVLEHVTVKPLSLEVFADDFTEMERQARKISGWGENVYVKIPITNSRGGSSLPLVRTLSADGIKVNVTAILTQKQLSESAVALCPTAPAIISVFNGRIMDTGEPPLSIIISNRPHSFLWASTREPYNIWQAENLLYNVITVPEAILSKAREMQGKDLGQLSLETVQMFKRDAEGYTV